ncbi:hypothetical protein ACFL4Z_01685 [candidate division KSB1 bacterium]
MAKKGTSFLSKVRKEKTEVICPVCGKSISYLLFVKSVKSEVTGAWRFNKKNLGVCKCNEEEVWR